MTIDTRVEYLLHLPKPVIGSQVFSLLERSVKETGEVRKGRGFVGWWRGGLKAELEMIDVRDGAYRVELTILSSPHINCADKFSLSPLGDDPVAYVPCCVLRSPPIKPDESYKALVFHSQPTPSSNVLGLCYTLMGHLDVQLYMSALQRSLEDANRAEV